jgi:phytoene dehydrogenase-like protein
MTGKKKIVVIGSGVGGSGLGALLANKGFDVTVLERNAYVGGKAAGFEKDGFIFDMGAHYNARGERGPLGEITRRIGGDLCFMKPDPFMRLQLLHSMDVPVDISSLKERLKLALTAGIPLYKGLPAFKLINSMLNIRREKDAEPYDGMRLRDYINSFTQDQSLHKMITMFCWLLLAVPYTEASAGEFMWCFSTWFNDAGCSYPKGSFREIAGSFIRSLQAYGGSISLNSPVNKIEITDGKVKGVYAKGEFIEADIVVSNAGLVNTVKLAGESHFHPAYVKRAFALKNSWSGVTVKYALDEILFDIPIIMVGWGKEAMDLNILPSEVEKDIVGEHPIIFMPIPSQADPDLAPKGKQLAIACCFAPSEREKDDYCDRLVDKLDQIVKRRFPEIPKHTLWEMKTTPKNARAASGRIHGDAIGLAQTYDQCGKNRPDPRMPIKNLYLVGTDAGGRGVGVDMAGDSALKVSAMVAMDADLF